MRCHIHSMLYFPCMQQVRFRLLFLFFAFLLAAHPALPAIAAEPGFFNPNFLISDDEIQNWRAMNRDDIQAFLHEQGGYLARYSAEDADGAVRPAWDIIARAAETHRINPKYILVKLQKEQSLLTDPSPTQKQLDWATGYGVCDACSTTDPSIQKHKGFGIQTDSAAGIIRWYYDNVNISPIVKRPNTVYAIDGVFVQPANFATAFLYTYTPHILGNKNFWVLWQKWFEQSYPDGTLAQSTGDATVYIIQNGQKRPFANMTALVSRFDPTMILSVPPSELAEYETGPSISLPNYAVLKSGDQYYLLDYEILRPFADASVVGKLGYNPDEIIDVADADVSGFTIGATVTADTQSPLGRLVRIKENNQLYYLKDGAYQFVSHPGIARTRFPNMQTETASAAILAGASPANPLLFADGALFGVIGFNKIYVTEHGRKRHIPTEAVFLALGYAWDRVIWVDEFTGLNHPTGSPISAPKTMIASTHEAPAAVGAPKNDVMVATREENTTMIGAEFKTQVDAYVVADAATGEILAGKNIDVIRPMASFAKVVSAYRLLKEGVSLSRGSTFDPLKHKTPYHNFRIAAGESVFNEHLMLAFLVSSLNTPGNMLIGSIEKDIEKFIARMNAQAKEWGLSKTIFKDVNGEEVGTQTTAREYLLAYRHATDNIDVKRFLGTANYRYDELRDIDGKPTHYDSHSNALVERQGLPFRILASKTGYLDEAGAGLVMTIERLTDARQFIIITMGNPDNSVRKFDEPEKLARWAIASL